MLRVSFIIPSGISESIGQSLADIFPDGVVVSPLRAMSYKPFQADGECSLVTGWLSRQPAVGLNQRLAALGGRGIKMVRERQRDWLRESKASFPSQRIHGFFIVPAWRRIKVPRGLRPIRLLQGQAFGTGLHASTRLMLRAVSRFSFHGEERVLDVGAGSGILSFACLLKGAGQALAVELEAAACKEMRANAKENGFSPGRFKVVEGVFPAKGKTGRDRYPLILANLTAPVLKKIVKPLAWSLEPGGRLWMSGIHGPEEARQTASACRGAGLRTTLRRKLGKWYFLEAR